MSNDTVIASLKQKIDELNQQAWEARVNDSPKAFILSQESVELARSINYSKGLAEGLRSLGFGYIRLFKNDEAAPLLREALTLFQSLNDLTGQAIVYEYLGIIERNWGNLGRSLELLLKGNELVRQANDSAETEVTSCYQIGVTYKHLGNHENALDYLYRALSLAKKTEFTLMESYAINIIGSIYFDNGDYEQALDCYQKGLVIRRESHDKWGEAGSLDNIGFTYLKLNELEKAIDYCKQSLGISRDNGDKKGEANALLHLAEIYGKAGDVTRASKFSHESLEIRTARGDKRGEAEVLLFLADLHKKKGEIEDQYIFEWISRALKITDEIKAQDLLSKAYYNLHEYHNQKGNYREALAQLNAHLKIEKELHKNTINQKVTNLEITHKAEAISQRNKELTELNEQIEKANAELRIESSLERVRARTMAMHQSEELMDVVRLVYEEFEKLQINNESTDIEVGLIDEETGVASMWAHFYKSDGTISTFKFPFNHFPVVREEYKIWKATSPEKRKQLFFTAEISGERVKEFLDLSDELPELAEIFKPLKDAGITKWVTHNAYFSHGVLTLQGTEAYSPATLDILKRLAVVFEQTYIRFLDLKRAEAQAREARIEAALERVRSRSMAMHKSDEMLEVVASVFQQMQLLGFNLNLCNIVLFDSKTLGGDYWASASEQAVLPEGYHVPYADHPFYHYQLNTWKNAEPFAMFELSGELKNSWDDILFTKTDLQRLPDSTKKMMQQLDSVIISSVATKHGLVQAIGTEQLSNDDISVLSRFAKVFEQTYTRFLDLQKAEAQARESQIEAALERVRSRTMGMQRSDELPEAANLLFRQIESLGIHVFSTGYNIWQEGKKAVTSWMSSQGLIQQPFSLPLTEEPALAECYEAAIRGDTFYVQELSGDKLISHLSYMRALPGVGELMGQMSEAGISLPNRMLNHHAFFLQGYLLFITYDPVPEAHEIFRRFAKVFEQTYTRFLDLQKAEAQAREAQIEAALEKIRSTSLGMHHSEEITNVVEVLFGKLKELGLLFDGGAAIHFFKEGSRDAVICVISPELNAPIFNDLPYDEEAFVNNQIILDVWKAKNTGEHIINRIYSLEQKNRYFNDYLFKYNNDIAKLPQHVRDFIRNARSYTATFIAEKNSLLGASSWTEQLFSNKEIDVLKRVARVFEQAYVRFLDLQKAEAQAREAQIEASLERVRSRTMAMHKSDEVMDVAGTLFDELQKLGFNFGASSIIIMDKQTGDAEYWIAGFTKNRFPESYQVKYFTHPYHDALLSSWKKGEKFLVYKLEGKDKKTYDEVLFTRTGYKNIPRQEQELMRGIDSVTFSIAFMKHGALHWGPAPVTGEQAIILQRFSNVFEQSYTRFLDLKNAEAQAREAQIEAALERVRAKVMAMTNSNDLNETSLVFGEQLRKLDIDWQFSYFWLIEEEKNENTFWITWPDNKTSITTYTLEEAEQYFNECLVSWRAGIKIHDNYVPPPDVRPWLDTFQRIADDAGGVARQIMTSETFGNGVFYYDAMMKYGSFGICINKPATDEEKNIQCRFAIEFERAYTRFLDLKKAEAQAREAQIEVAVERVRAKALAMHKSEDLHAVVVTLKKELNGLQIPGVTAATIYLQQDDGSIRILDLSTAREDEEDKLELTLDKVFRIEDTYPDLWVRRIWYGNEDYFVVEADEADFVRVVTWLSTIDKEGAAMAQNIIKEKAIKKAWLPTVKLHKGKMNIDLLQPPGAEIESIMLKMGAGFDLAYKRFLDLQKAEAQTREATIEVALERVRARALAMQQPEELKDVAQVLRNEMGALGVEELETSSIYIHGESSENVECWYALKDSKGAEKRMVSDHFVLNLNDTWVGREMKKFYSSGEKQTSIVMQGDNRKEWIEYCYNRSPAFSGFYGETIPERTYHLYKFSHGYIGAAAPGNISSESWKLLGRAASVFSLAYSRFKDLTQARIDLIKLKEEKKRAEDALTELQNTQKQLVQTEKMASLGELTAGIAHEIQNPLNFVNNFSDVSNELIEEMKEELANGNTQQAMIIANDVKDNLDKILHHGKRADGIVKGMLQHSRSSSGIKEPTDINNLADEYLRLAYHGFRAKDKSFSAKFETNFDSRIEKINVVPQDIGRVILNLINNAFYTVNEKKKQVENGYDPIVTVSTKKIKGKVEISVKDNGNGIPQKVLDKIFQPFFTTKPTGEGTGLGLSLSYDIVTKGHGGQIMTNTEEGKGSEFIISLPVN